MMASIMDSARRRVLVVDDDSDCADSLSDLVSCLGAEPFVVHSGAAALEALRHFRPHVVLLDIGMPVMDGCETARRMRACDEGRDLLLIALTGWGRPEDRARSREAGIDHHMVKPGDIDLLAELLFASTSTAI